MRTQREKNPPQGPAAPDSSVLRISGLRTCLETRKGKLYPVDGVDLKIPRGKIVGLVGESGCGKSMMANSVMGLLPQGGRISDGEILFCGEDFLSYTAQQRRELYGDRLTLIFQEPMSSLNPVIKAGPQVAEVLMLHKDLSRDEAKRQVIEMFRSVGIPEPEKRVRQYPHQFSGGMRQRVMIAIAFACDPKILICDEPTTALDVTIQGQILDIIKRLMKKNNTSVIMITHDLGVVANIAQEIAVMYSGIIVERGACRDVFYRPRHPYTWALLQSVPRLDLENKQVLASIPGTPPDLLNPPVGCPFSTRCQYCMPVCKNRMPENTDFGGGHSAACWLHHPMAPKVDMPDRKGDV